MIIPVPRWHFFCIRFFPHKFFLFEYACNRVSLNKPFSTKYIFFFTYLDGLELHGQTALKITVNIQCCNVGECLETFKRCTRERHTKNAVYVYISCIFNLKGQKIHMQLKLIEKNKMNEILLC